MMPSPPETGQDFPIRIDPVYFCWIWLNGLTKDGYGLWKRNTRILAHRRVYEMERGPIGEGMALDHWCRRRDCVNPNHLEPVKQSINERRKNWRHRARMTVCCQRGHRKFEDGIRTPSGGLVCKVCE